MRFILFLLISLLVSPYSLASEAVNKDQAVGSEEEATELAIETLSRKIGAEKPDITVIRLSRFNWPNSALGCPKPGVSYADVVVPGYMALLKHGKQPYRVHIGNGRGIICELSRKPEGLAGVKLDNLKKMAIQDLASKMGADPQKITVVGDQTMVWPDTNFGCSSGLEPAVPKTIRGYLIELEFRGQTFEYRTSQNRVLPCPPILNK